MKKFNTYEMAIASILCGLSVVFQILPLILSEIFVILTMGSIIPLYLNTKKCVSLGLLSVFVIFFIVCLFTVHEGLFFLFTNAVVGFVLGFCANKKFSFFPSWVLLTLSLTASMVLLYRLIGLNAIVYMPNTELMYGIFLLCVNAVISMFLYLMIRLVDRMIFMV